MTALLVSAVVLLVIILVALVAFGVVTLERLSQNHQVIPRLDALRVQLDNIMVEDTTTKHRTPDGMFIADSFQGLMEQMVNNPESTESFADVDELKKFFEEQDDEDDDKEDWQKEK
jgi:hypothetical protein